MTRFTTAHIFCSPKRKGPISKAKSHLRKGRSILKSSNFLEAYYQFEDGLTALEAGRADTTQEVKAWLHVEKGTAETGLQRFVEALKSFSLGRDIFKALGNPVGLMKAEAGLFYAEQKLKQHHQPFAGSDQEQIRAA